MLGRAAKAHRGDTIVEVLFAITIFSLIAVAAMTLMNRGLSASQQSLEITAVRQQIDGQAEALRFLHSAYIEAYQTGVTPAAATPAGKYNTILNSYLTTSASAFGEVATCVIPASTKFIVDPKNGVLNASPATFTTAATEAKLVYTDTSTPTLTRSEGVWVEAVRSAPTGTNGVGFVDFHIRACWDAPGRPLPLTLGTIVRLYDPR